VRRASGARPGTLDEGNGDDVGETIGDKEAGSVGDEYDTADENGNEADDDEDEDDAGGDKDEENDVPLEDLGVRFALVARLPSLRGADDDDDVEVVVDEEVMGEGEEETVAVCGVGICMGWLFRLITLKLALPMKDLGAAGSGGDPSITACGIAVVVVVVVGVIAATEDDGRGAKDEAVGAVERVARACRASACASMSAASDVTPAEGCTVCLCTLNLMMKGDAADLPLPLPRPRPLWDPAPALRVVVAAASAVVFAAPSCGVGSRPPDAPSMLVVPHELTQTRWPVPLAFHVGPAAVRTQPVCVGDRDRP
jgi:hypothetical protein